MTAHRVITPPLSPLNQTSFVCYVSNTQYTVATQVTLTGLLIFKIHSSTLLSNLDGPYRQLT